MVCNPFVGGPSFVAQNWTAALGLAETESWAPWTLDGCQRMGGYVTRYAGNFDFLTVRGSGKCSGRFRRRQKKEEVTKKERTMH